MDAGSIDILLASIGDEPEIASLMEAFNQVEGIVWRPGPMRAALRRVLSESELGLVLVARDRVSRAVVGYGLATYGYDLEFAGRDAFITELFVSAPVRGHGLGRRLLESLVQRLREHGVNAAHLMVRPENERARALYESHGFHASPRIMMTKLTS